MRTADRSLDVIAFVSEHFRDILRRRLSELTGLALITLALLGAIALATWSVQDPSLSHATQKPINNLLGFPGAIFADLGPFDPTGLNFVPVLAERLFEDTAEDLTPSWYAGSLGHHDHGGIDDHGGVDDHGHHDHD